MAIENNSFAPRKLFDTKLLIIKHNQLNLNTQDSELMICSIAKHLSGLGKGVF